MVCHGSAIPVAPAPQRPLQLSPQQLKTLELLLSGRSEKEVAAALGLSTHTVHVYVTGLHKRFGVRSRAELMARFVPDFRAADLVQLIRRGRLHRRRATVGTWVSLCGRNWGGTMGLWGGDRGDTTLPEPPAQSVPRLKCAAASVQRRSRIAGRRCG